MTRQDIPTRAIAIGIAYFLAAAASVRFTRFEGGVAFIWVANALVIVELSLRRPRDWPVTLAASAIGCSAATAIFGLGIAIAPAVALVMMTEAAGAAWLLGRFRAGRVDLGSMKSFIVFACAAGIIAPGLGAIAGAAIIGAASGTGFWLNWAHWYVGHALGNIILGPIAVLVLSGEFAASFRRLPVRRRSEAVILTAAMIVVTAIVFRQRTLPILFLPMLPMMIAAFRFGRFGSAVAIVMLAVVGGAMTLAGDGPVQLIAGTSGMKALFFQFYLVVAAFMTLPVAAVLQQQADLFRALRDSEARYRLLMEGSSDVILNVDRTGHIRYVSPSVMALVGREADTLIGTRAAGLMMSEDRGMAAATHRRALADPSASFMVEFRVLTAEGMVIWCESHTRAVTDDHDRAVGVVSQIRTIAHHKTVAAELSRVARTDALTGLVNRRVFDETLDQRIEDVRAGHGTGCCAILDLDFFKRVNDRHGHDAGDRVLREFAQVAAAVTRDGDVIARLGGEEFGLILWGADIGKAHGICDRLRREVADLSVVVEGGAEIAFTFSGGIAAIGTGTREETVSEADAALYRAKDAGRNRLAIAG